MSADRTEIDQVIVKKVGGYNLQTTSWWQGLTPVERQGLLDGGDVQFFASGAEVEPHEAAALLSPTAGGASSAPRLGADAVRLAWPDPVTGIVNAVYRREVVAGPRWMVSRVTEAGSVELFSARGCPSPEVYDLGHPDAAHRLSHDLFIDALGLTGDVAASIESAIRHFKESFFDPHLGNRPWEVSADRVRKSVESNPFLELVPRAQLPAPRMSP